MTKVFALPPITPYPLQNLSEHRVSDFKFEEMLNKWSVYFNILSRIPVKKNFDLTLSISAGFDNLSTRVGSAG